MEGSTINSNLVNEAIKASQVRLVGVPGYDIVDFNTAMGLAEESGLDLVAMNTAEVPVCKLLDLDKLAYERKKQAKKNNNHSVVKEIRMTPFIADNDMHTKGKQVSRILSEGNKVKVVVTYKGRTIRDVSDGQNMLNDFNSIIEHPHKLDKSPTIEGNKVYMVVSPVK